MISHLDGNTRLVWAEIDLEAIAGNISALKQLIPPQCVFMAVVKANAYGHGDLSVAKTAIANGAGMLGVARIEEGVRLREAGIKAPILILGHTPPHLALDLITYDLTQTLYALPTARQMAECVKDHKRPLKVHIKIDTGMGRLGCMPGFPHVDLGDLSMLTNALNEVMAITRLPELAVEGLYTHLAGSDLADKTYAHQQLALFRTFVSSLADHDVRLPLIHAANSGAIIDLPESHFDMVRAGISIYGLYPSKMVNCSKVLLTPAMTLKTRIIHLKNVPRGTKISYGMTYSTHTSTTIATVPVGYADGLNRLLSSKGHMLVCGKKAPIVGRVCMDQTMLDVGHIPAATLDAEVVVMGKQNGAEHSIDDIAEQLDTINYEVVCAVSDRVPRIYRASK